MKGKVNNKIIMWLLSMFFVLSSIGLPSGVFSINTYALQSNYEAKTSDYYNQLTEKSKKFYNAIYQMDKSEDLKTGIANFDLVSSGIVSAEEVEQYGKGNKQLLVDFASAKDAYMLDHPEVFYVDFDKFSMSMGTKNGEAYATIGTGRTNSYLNTGFVNDTQVTTSMAYVDAVLNINVESYTTLEEKIKAINLFMLPLTKYGFEDASEPDAQNHIRSVFGFARFGLSVCEGYAKTFKYICDNSGVDCKVVYGYLIDDGDGSAEPHAWNVVKLDNGNWYAVDITRNDANANPAKYLFVGSEELYVDHIEDGKVSDNSFEFNYPTLALYNLGQEKITTHTKYVKNSDGDATMVVEVSYNGKNTTKLKEEDNIYIAMSHLTKTSNIWSNPFVCNDIEMFVKHFDSYSEYYLDKYYKVQFFATSTPPTVQIDELAMGYVEPIQNPEATSNIISNDFYEIEISQNSPALVDKFSFSANGVTYSHKNALPVEQTYNVTLVYDEPLKLTTSLPNITVTNISDANISNFVKIDNVVFDGNKTITFNFTPSLRYQHHYVSYGFTPYGLVTDSNNSIPQTAYASFRRKEVICSKILGDGRLYMQAYASPILIDNSDLSVSGWKYKESGITKIALENQRSQMALVVTKPSNEAQISIDNYLTSNEEYIYKSETYELDINICGGLATIPNGSYVKLAFGFPEGYNYDSLDDGVTFKIYHFKKDAYGHIDYNNPVLMDVVITEYGLVVETDSFSPFAVVVVDKDETTTNKFVYARSINNFGSISADGKSITGLRYGSVEFDVVSNNGYMLDFLLLDGKDITSRVADGKVTLTYEELQNNSKLEASFVNKDTKEFEETNNIVLNQKSFMQNQIAFENTIKDANEPKFNTNVVIIISIIAGVVIVSSVIGAIVFVKKKSRINSNKI